MSDSTSRASPSMRRAVEPLPGVEDVGQPPRRHGDGLDRAGHVGELELDLLDAGFAGGGEDPLGRPAVQIQATDGVVRRAGAAGAAAPAWAPPPFARRSEGVSSCGVVPVLSGISFLPRGRGPSARLCVGMDEKVGDEDEENARGEEAGADPEYRAGSASGRRLG